jgi:hypothetical protein
MEAMHRAPGTEWSLHNLAVILRKKTSCLSMFSAFQGNFQLGLF